jgi:hypothetical protein
MTRLMIRIKRNDDGTSALSCTRADGSVTWQRQSGSHARFFALHDLTHYAVETVLGHRRGFFGLLAEGWEISDFGTPWPRGPIPADADPSELIVGFLDADRHGDSDSTAEAFNSYADQFFQKHGIRSPVHLSDDQLKRIRRKMEELFAGWNAVPPGQAMELLFEVPATAAPQQA